MSSPTDTSLPLRMFFWDRLQISLTQHWEFSDIRTGKLIAKVTDSDNGNGPALTCCHSHPDGLIFGTGTSDAMIKIWDLKEVR